MVISRCLLTFFFFIFASLVYADIEEANNNYDAKNYIAAAKEYLLLANDGNAIAETKLAIMYMNGYGLNKDLVEAFTLLGKAANQGNAEAEYWYGTFLLNGYGTEKSTEKCIPWFEKAAKQGQVDAQSSLGVLYMIGLGTETNYDKSFYWIAKAAEMGNITDMYNLGQLYEKGKGVELNLEKSIFWYQKAADQGHVFAQFEMGYAREVGAGGLEKDERKAIEWYEKAANSGNMPAQFNLGLIYLKKTSNKEVSLKKSIFWLSKAASQDDAKSMTTLANVLLNKSGPVYSFNTIPLKVARPELFLEGAPGKYIRSSQNIMLAIDLLHKAAAKNYESANRTLSELIMENEAHRNFTRAGYIDLAFKWPTRNIKDLEKEAANGDTLAQEKTCILYQFGILDASRNDLRAAQCYLKIINSNVKVTTFSVQQHLGLLYIESVLSDSEPKTVKNYIDAKADSGDIAAIRFLARFYTNAGSDSGNSIKLARYWYSKLALTGDLSAHLVLADLYMTSTALEIGPDSSPDYPVAIFWLNRAAERNDPTAQYHLAKLYLEGKVVEKNENVGLVWLTKAANKNLLAKVELANLYKNSTSSVLNYPKSLELFESAASLSAVNSTTFPDIALGLADIYEHGLGTKPDHVRAYKWYALAAKSIKQLLSTDEHPSCLNCYYGSMPINYNSELAEYEGSLKIETGHNQLVGNLEMTKVKLNQLKTLLTPAEFASVSAL